MSENLKPRLVSPKLEEIRRRRDAIIRLTNAILMARKRSQDKVRFGVLKEFYIKKGNERQSASERVLAHEEARKSILFLIDESSVLEIESKKDWLEDPGGLKSGFDKRWFEIKGVMSISQDSVENIRGLHWEERTSRRKEEGLIRPRKGKLRREKKRKKT